MEGTVEIVGGSSWASKVVSKGTVKVKGISGMMLVLAAVQYVTEAQEYLIRLGAWFYWLPIPNRHGSHQD